MKSATKHVKNVKKNLYNDEESNAHTQPLNKADEDNCKTKTKNRKIIY